VLASTEIVVQRQIRCGLETDFIDASVVRPLANIFNDLIHRRSPTLQQKLDAAVRQVERVSTKPMRLRRIAHEVAKTYALHLSAYVTSNAMHDGLQ